ncbi:MAG: phosphoribosylpyrophosphate synthetase [Acidimicrobiales bacterium]
MDAPDTVTEAVAFLTEQGYVDELGIEGGGLVCPAADGSHPLESAVIDHQFRFEGPSDPADESIVLGITLPQWERRGVLVSAYGPDMPPEQADVLLALTRR